MRSGAYRPNEMTIFHRRSFRSRNAHIHGSTPGRLASIYPIFRIAISTIPASSCMILYEGNGSRYCITLFQDHDRCHGIPSKTRTDSQRLFLGNGITSPQRNGLLEIRSPRTRKPEPGIPPFRLLIMVPDRPKSHLRKQAQTDSNDHGVSGQVSATIVREYFLYKKCPQSKPDTTHQGSQLLSFCRYLPDPFFLPGS